MIFTPLPKPPTVSLQVSNQCFLYWENRPSRSTSHNQISTFSQIAEKHLVNSLSQADSFFSSIPHLGADQIIRRGELSGFFPLCKLSFAPNQKQTFFPLRQRNKQTPPLYKPTFLPVLWTNFLVFTVCSTNYFFHHFLLNNLFSFSKKKKKKRPRPTYHLVRPLLARSDSSSGKSETASARARPWHSWSSRIRLFGVWNCGL